MPVDALPVRTERLLLRAFRPGDTAALTAMHADADTARFLSRPTRSAAEVRETIARRSRQIRLEAPGDGLVLAVVVVESAALVGECSVWLHADRRAEIGFAVATPHRGHGYALEAARGVIGLARDTGLVDTVVARVHPDNAASIAILRRLGMTPSPSAAADGDPYLGYELRVRISG